MKIAFLILAHKEPLVVKRIIERLSHNSNFNVYVHVDLKADLNDYFINKENVKYVKNRFNIAWAGFSSIDATIELLKMALIDNCDRYMLLQGLDYPLHSNEYIYKYFKENRDQEFINAINITKSSDYKMQRKVRCYWRYDTKNIVEKIIFKIWNFSNTIFGIKFKENHFNDMDIYWGWAQFAITKECANFIVDFYNHELKFNKFISTCMPPDEMYFHTIIHNNDKFKIKKLDDNLLNLTYFEYPDVVRVFKQKDELNNLDMSRYLFIRKLTSESTELMDYLDGVKE